MLALTRSVDRLVRVLHEPLRAGERAWDVEAPIEVTQVLGRLECFFKRGLGQPQRRSQPLELARVDLFHRRIIAPQRPRMLAPRERAPTDPPRIADSPVRRRTGARGCDRQVARACALDWQLAQLAAMAFHRRP